MQLTTTSQLTITIPGAFVPAAGHSSRCMFIASMALICLPSLFWRVAIATWSVMTAMSRVVLGRHYLGDVTVGSMLGISLAAVLSQGTFEEEHLMFKYNFEEIAAHMKAQLSS